MKNQMTNTNEGDQARVKNLLHAIQQSEVESNMGNDALKEQMVIAELEMQEEQDVLMEQMVIAELEWQEEQDVLMEQMVIAGLEMQEEQDAIAKSSGGSSVLT